jgi:hypothetical protein
VSGLASSRGRDAGPKRTWRIRAWSAPDKTMFSGTGRGFKAEPGAGVEAMLATVLDS